MSLSRGRGSFKGGAGEREVAGERGGEGGVGRGWG